jgi:hypothetical protein
MLCLKISKNHFLQTYPMDTNEQIRVKLVGLSCLDALNPITVVQNVGDKKSR